MGTYYDRYSKFKDDGVNQIVPFIKIETNSTDITVLYSKDTMRMDTLSYKYYGDANYGWLIMMANPKYGSLEYNIPNNVSLRIPYPLSTAISRYETAVDKYKGKFNSY